MIKIKIEIKLYHYAELKENAKNKAFKEHKSFLWELGQEYEEDNGILKMNYSEPEKETVENSLNINEYLFFNNGEIADTITYTGKHKKKGTTEFNFLEKKYIIKRNKEIKQ